MPGCFLSQNLIERAGVAALKEGNVGSWWSEEKCSELDRAGPVLSSFLLSWLPSLFSTWGHYSDVQRIQVKCVSISLVTFIECVLSAHGTSPGVVHFSAFGISPLPKEREPFPLGARRHTGALMWDWH